MRRGIGGETSGFGRKGKSASFPNLMFTDPRTFSFLRIRFAIPSAPRLRESQQPKNEYCNRAIRPIFLAASALVFIRLLARSGQGWFLRSGYKKDRPGRFLFFGREGKGCGGTIETIRAEWEN